VGQEADYRWSIAGIFEDTIISAIIWLVGDIYSRAKGVGRTLGAAALTCSETRVPEDDQVMKIVNKESWCRV